MEKLKQRLAQFSKERDWEKFHNPKNLVMALSAEAGELTELFQWLTEEEAAQIMKDPKTGQLVKHEVADVFLYLLRLVDVLGIDLLEAASQKMEVNAEKYPIEYSKGLATKYNRK